MPKKKILNFPNLVGGMSYRTPRWCTHRTHSKQLSAGGRGGMRQEEGLKGRRNRLPKAGVGSAVCLVKQLSVMPASHMGPPCECRDSSTWAILHCFPWIRSGTTGTQTSTRVGCQYYRWQFNLLCCNISP